MKPMKDEILNAWRDASDSVLYYTTLNLLSTHEASFDLNLIRSLSFELKKFLIENNA